MKLKKIPDIVALFALGLGAYAFINIVYLSHLNERPVASTTNALSCAVDSSKHKNKSGKQPYTFGDFCRDWTYYGF